MPSGTDEHESHSSVSLLRVRERADEKNIKSKISKRKTVGE